MDFDLRKHVLVVLKHALCGRGIAIVNGGEAVPARRKVAETVVAAEVGGREGYGGTFGIGVVWQ